MDQSNGSANWREVPPHDGHGEPHWHDTKSGVTAAMPPRDALGKCRKGCGNDIGLTEFNDNAGLCDECAQEEAIAEQVRRNTHATVAHEPAGSGPCNCPPCRDAREAATISRATFNSGPIRAALNGGVA